MSMDLEASGQVDDLSHHQSLLVVGKQSQSVKYSQNQSTPTVQLDSNLQGNQTVQLDSNLQGNQTVQLDSNLQGNQTVQLDSNLQGNLTVHLRVL